MKGDEKLEQRYEVEKKLGLNGLAVVIVLFGLYGISCTAIQSWQIYMNDFAGRIELGLCALVISAIWLALYWFLDRLRHESVKITVFTFCLGVIAYVCCKSVLDWIIGDIISEFMEHIGIPVCSFFFIFVFVVVRLRSFDELVDAFIYGGFVGTGIAFAACMTDFMHYDSFDGQFIIIALITNIAVYAAICSLSGCMMHRALLKQKSLHLVLSLVVMATLFTVHYIFGQLTMTHLAYAKITILPVLIAASFAIVLVIVVVILIHRILKKDAIDSESSAVPETTRSPVAIIAAVLAMFFLGGAWYVRYDVYRTKQFVSVDKKWSFVLPANWSEKEETVDDSIFNFAIPTGNVCYTNESGSIMMYLFFDAQKELAHPLRKNHIYGWDVTLGYDQCIATDSYDRPFVLYQTSYVLKKDDDTIFVDVFTDKEADTEAMRAARLLIKSLEAKHD